MQVLFPYAAERLQSHLEVTFNSADTQKDIQLFREQVIACLGLSFSRGLTAHCAGAQYTAPIARKQVRLPLLPLCMGFKMQRSVADGPPLFAAREAVSTCRRIAMPFDVELQRCRQLGGAAPRSVLNI